MDSTVHLRPIRNVDHLVLREVYSDAIYSQCSTFYSIEQIDAWASLATLPSLFDRCLVNGSGWLLIKRKNVEAFAVRFPSNRLALLYCRGRSSRQGFATKLLYQIELDALNEGRRLLFTEASALSYPLLLRFGWIQDSVETILIAGVRFKRYKLSKRLFR